MSRHLNNGNEMGDWDPLDNHFRSANVYRRNQPRDENEECDEESLKKLFIANIPAEVNANGLRNWFAQYGKVVEVNVVPDKNKPGCQLGFVTAETKADALKIIDQCDGFRIGALSLRVRIQRPKKKSNEEKEFITSRKTGSAGSSDSDSHASNSTFQNHGRPVGRSQRLMAAALSQETSVGRRSQEPSVGRLSQEPSVGRSRNGADFASGFGKQHISHGGSSSSDEVEPARNSGHRAQDAAKSFAGSLPPQASGSSQVLSGPSPTEPQKMSQKSPRGASARRPDSCVSCGLIGYHHCMNCGEVYCSRNCQRTDWPYHKNFCRTKKADEFEVDEEFERRFTVNFSSEFLQAKAEIIQESLQLEKTVIPLNTPLKAVCLATPSSPSDVYMFLDSNRQKLSELSAKLHQHYNTTENQQTLKTTSKVGDFCVSQFSDDGFWYRAEVEAVSGQKVTVRYVDFGNREEVDKRNVCEIVDELKLIPHLAVRCCLSDVDPLGPGMSGDSWSEKAVKFLKETVPISTTLTMTAICFKNNAYHVQLLLSDGSDVGKKLVDAGLAKHSQKSMRSSPSTEPSCKPDGKKREAEKNGKLSAYGWPSDLNRLKGQRMMVEFVELAAPGELLIRFDPLPGYQAPPTMRLLVDNACEDHSIRHVESEVVKPRPEVRRYQRFDLPTLELQAKVEVAVTLPQDPGSFFCQDKVQMSRLIEQQKRLTPPNPLSSSSYIPEANEICLGFHEKYKAWCRLEILEKSGDSASVFLIDYGEKMTLPLNLLLPLPQELAKFPPMAFSCQMPACHSLMVLALEIPKHFQKIVADKTLLCEILSCDPTSGVRSVVLIDPRSGSSVASELFKAFERGGF